MTPNIFISFVLFSHNVLQISSGIDEMGTMVWPLFFTLVFCWVCTYFAIWKGVKVTGKIMYFTGTHRAPLLTNRIFPLMLLPLSEYGQFPVSSAKRSSYLWLIPAICEIAVHNFFKQVPLLHQNRGGRCVGGERSCSVTAIVFQALFVEFA